jgi:hypothetical protein
VWDEMNTDVFFDIGNKSFVTSALKLGSGNEGEEGGGGFELIYRCNFFFFFFFLCFC